MFEVNLRDKHDSEKVFGEKLAPYCKRLNGYVDVNIFLTLIYSLGYMFFNTYMLSTSITI